MKKIVLLGATGSLGKKVVELVLENNKEYEIVGISIFNNYKKAFQICDKLKIKNLSIFDTDIDYDYINMYAKNNNLKIFIGENSILKLLDFDYDLLINCMSGTDGLLPTIKAIKQNKKVAIANKEIIVIAGYYLNKLNNIKKCLIPIDSEHSAIFQLLCDIDNNKEIIKNITLTSSGGSLRDYSYDELKNVTVKQVLSHPNWNMGDKITVDSATLVNKALERLEAHYLFDIPLENIDLIIHRQSYIHGLVEYYDGNIKCLMSHNDMKIPINFAMSFPHRKRINLKYKNILDFKKLTFEEINLSKYPLLELSLKVFNTGGSLIIVFNSVNQAAVEEFLNGKIGFLQINEVVSYFINKHTCKYNISLDEILYLNKYYYEETKRYINKKF